MELDFGKENGEGNARKAATGADVHDVCAGTKGDDFGNTQRVEHVMWVEVVDVFARDNVDFGVPIAIEGIEGGKLALLLLSELGKIARSCSIRLLFGDYLFGVSDVGRRVAWKRVNPRFFRWTLRRLRKNGWIFRALLRSWIGDGCSFRSISPPYCRGGSTFRCADRGRALCRRWVPALCSLGERIAGNFCLEQSFDFVEREAIFFADEGDGASGASGHGLFVRCGARNLRDRAVHRS